MQNQIALGIEHLCVLGMRPAEFVNLAADLGCPWISTGFTPVANNAMGFGEWSLLEDAVLRREMQAAMRDRGVAITMGEGFWVMPGGDVRDSAPALEMWREMDVGRIGTLSFDPDLNRSFDQFSLLAEMAAEQEMEVVLEFVPSLAIPDLATAVKAMAQVNRDNFSILIDTLHLHRCGANADDLRALPDGAIGYLQLCDAPLVPTIEDYAVEATFERLPPGAGELPLLEILNAIPADTFIGLEIPMLTRARAGESFESQIQSCIDGAHALLQQRSST